MSKLGFWIPSDESPVGAHLTPPPATPHTHTEWQHHNRAVRNVNYKLHMMAFPDSGRVRQVVGDSLNPLLQVTPVWH